MNLVFEKQNFDNNKKNIIHQIKKIINLKLKKNNFFKFINNELLLRKLLELKINKNNKLIIKNIIKNKIKILIFWISQIFLID